MSKNGPNRNSGVPTLYMRLAVTAVPKNEAWEYTL